MATADELIDASQAYADAAVVDGNEFVERLDELLDEGEYVVQSLPVPEYQERFSNTSTTIILPDRPALTIVTPVSVLPVAPEIELSPIEDGDVVVPDFDENAPALTFPDVPSTALPSVPASPTINEPDYPSAPSIVFPTAPTLTNPDLPVAPVITIPTFDATAPADDLVVPTNTFEYAEVAYSSALLDAALAKLLDDIENGGYGIEPDDEQRLFERARAREFSVAQGQMDEIMQQASSRGFPLPPGDMLVSMDRARVELQRKMAGINSDIMSKKADLYVENRKFTLQQTQQYESMLITYHNSVMERALNVERARVELSIAVYNTLVARYNARLQAYQTQAQVFESRVRAEVAKIEIYKAQVEGARLQTDLQRLILQNYEAQLGAIASLVGIYRTQLEAAQVKANIERTRIEVFQAEVQAYSTQVQAKVAQFNMYTSQVNAERAKIDAYQSQVNSYTSRVQAAQVKSTISLSRLKTETDQAQTLIGVYRAKIEGYAADLRGQVETINARLGKYSGEVNLYQADYNYLVEAMRLNNAAIVAETTERLKNADIAQVNAQLRLQAWEKARQIKVAAANSASTYFGSRASAALNGINALVSKATTA